MLTVAVNDIKLYTAVKHEDDSELNRIILSLGRLFILLSLRLFQSKFLD